MAKVEIEFILKNGDKVKTSNEAIIKQLKELGVQFNVVGEEAEESGKKVKAASEGNTQALDKEADAVDNAAKSYKDILSEYKANEKELKALAIAEQTGTARYKELQESVAAAADALDDAARQKRFNKSGADALIGSIGGLANGFAAAQGAIALFGGESENVQKALLKVQGAMALAQGIEGLKDAGDAFTALGKNAVKAFGSVKAAIAGTGIGLLIVGLPLLIGYWDELTAALNGTAAAQEEFNKKQSETNKKFADELSVNLQKVINDFDDYELTLRKVSEAAGKGDGLFDPANLKEFIKYFPEAAKLTGKETDYIDKANKIYQRRIELKKDEVKYQTNINKITELTAQYNQIMKDTDEARRVGNKALVTELNNQFDSVLRQIGGLRDTNAQLKTNIVTAQNGIDADLKGIEDAEKAKTKAEDDRKKREAAAITDARRRIELIDNELQKKLAALDQQYSEDKKKAKENFENLKVLEQLYLKNRQKILADFSESYKKETSQIYVELAAMAQGDYTLQEQLLVESNSKRLKELVTFQQQQLVFIKANGGDVVAEEARQAKDREALSKLGEELILKARKNALINGYKTLLDAEKSLNKDRLDEIKKGNNITEDLAKISLAVFKLDNAERVRLEQTAIRAATESDAKSILEKIQNKDVEVSTLTEKQKGLYDEYQKLLKENEGDEQKTKDAILAFNQKFTDDEIKRVQKFYKELTDQREKDFINETAYNDKVKALNEGNVERKLADDNAYFIELAKIQTQYLNDYEGYTKAKEKLDIDYANKALKRELDLVNGKIAAAEKDPSFDTAKLKELQNEKLKIETEIATATINLDKKVTDSSKTEAQKRYDNQTKLIQQFLSTLSEVANAIDEFYALQQAKTNAFYDNEIKKNTDARDAEVNNYALTSEEKQNISDEYALRETALEEKRNEELKKIRKKQADFDFGVQLAQIAGNTALGIMQINANPAVNLDITQTLRAILTGLIITAGIAQIAAATAAREQVKSLAKGGILDGPSHAAGGIIVGNTGIEVEGGEAVINKRSTAMYGSLLSAINVAGGGNPLSPNFSGGMALGGQMMFDTNSITQAIQQGIQNGTNMTKAYILSSDVQSDAIKTSRIRRQTKY
jgi:hypothetical protein